jgi:hypothetical protein
MVEQAEQNRQISMHECQFFWKSERNGVAKSLNQFSFVKSEVRSLTS